MDETYAELLKRTSGKPISEDLRRDILSYYADLEKPFATKKNPKDWQEVIKELDALRAAPAAGVHAVSPSRGFHFRDATFGRSGANGL
jgi:hypothetical protein